MVDPGVKQMNVNKLHNYASLKTRYFTAATWPLGMKLNLMGYGKQNNQAHGPLTLVFIDRGPYGSEYFKTLLPQSYNYFSSKFILNIPCGSPHKNAKVAYRKFENAFFKD